MYGIATPVPIVKTWMLSSRAQSQRKFALTFCNGTAVCEVFIQSVKKVIFLLTNKLERKMKNPLDFKFTHQYAVLNH
jgi:hypothetical protein